MNTAKMNTLCCAGTVAPLVDKVQRSPPYLHNCMVNCLKKEAPYSETVFASPSDLGSPSVLLSMPSSSDSSLSSAGKPSKYHRSHLLQSMTCCNERMWSVEGVYIGEIRIFAIFAFFGNFEQPWHVHISEPENSVGLFPSITFLLENDSE